MTEIGLDWFGKTTAAAIASIQTRLINEDAAINEMLKIGVNIGFGTSISEQTAEIEKRLRPMCQKAIALSRPGVGEDSRTPHNLPIWTFLAFVGIAVDCMKKGNANTAMEMIFNCGVVWGEVESRLLWQNDAIRGTKVIGGAKNSARKVNLIHEAERQVRFARMAQLVPSLGVENAARQCEAEGMGGWQGIKRQWDRHKKRDT